MIESSLMLLVFSFFKTQSIQSISTARQPSLIISEANARGKSNLIHVGEDKYSDLIFLDPSSIKRFGYGDEFWFRLVKRYGSGLQELSYQGSCASSAVKLQKVVIYDSLGYVTAQQKFKEGWIYPQQGSVLRNALKVGCKLL
jgi:hypothetical protein